METTSYSNEKEDRPKSKTERALETYKEFMRRSKEYTAPYFEKFDKIFADYLLSRAYLRRPYQRSDLRPPYSFIIVETFTPEIVEAFFADKPYINAVGRTPPAYLMERDMEDFLTYECDQMDIIPKFTVAVKSNCLFGTVIAKTPWKKISKPKADASGKVTMEKIYDLPDWENVRIWDFFPDPDCQTPGDVESMKACVHRVWRTFAQLKKNEKKRLQDGTVVGIYENLDKLKVYIDSKNSKTASYGATATSSNIERERDRRNSDKLMVDEYWGEFDAKGDGQMYEYVITVVDECEVIRCDVNPLETQYKPFLAAVDHPIPGEFYGAGEIEPTWSLIQEVRALRNARLDAVNMAVNPMYVVDRLGGFNLKNIYNRPGGILLGNDVNAIKRLDPPDNFLSAYREVSELDYGIQQAVALPNPSAGSAKVGAGYSRTTAGINFLQQQTNSRLVLKIRLLASLLVNKFFQRLMLLNAQFLPSQTWFRVTGKDEQENPFKMIPIEAFQHSYIFSTQTAMDRLSKQNRQANLKENIIPLLQLNEKANPMSFKWSEFIPDVLRDFDYREGIKYFRSEQEVQAMQQQQMQQQLQMAQANTQSQAQAQSALINQKGALDIQKKRESDAATLVKTLVKGVMDNEQAQINNEDDLTGKISTTILKAVTDDARDEASRDFDLSNRQPAGSESE